LGQCQKVTSHIIGDFSYHQIVKMQFLKRWQIKPSKALNINEN